MPADFPIFNGNTRHSEEEQSLDVPTIEVFSLNDASGPQASILDLSAGLSPDFIDITSLVQDEQLLDDVGQSQPSQLSQLSQESKLTTSEISLEIDGLLPMSQLSQEEEESDIVLTARQQRALRYIARRHMHHVRITRRVIVVDSEPIGKGHLITQENEHPVGARFIAPLDRVNGTTNPPDSSTISVPEEEMRTVSDQNGAGATSDQNGNKTADDARSMGNSGTSDGRKPDKSAIGGIGAINRPLRIEKPIQNPSTQNIVQARMGRIVTGPLPPMPPLVPKASGQGLVIGHFRPKSLVAQKRAKRQRRIMLRHLSRKHLRQARVVERRARRRMWINIACAVLSFLLVVFSLGSAAAIYGSNYVNSTVNRYNPKILTLRDLLPLDNLKVYDSKGILIGQLTDQGIHTTVALNQVAPSLKNATVATEDKDFWSNEGVDIQGILRAALINLQNGHVVEGGSTITQQLIKNLVVGNDPTLTRKLQEIILAPQINDHYTKSDILEMYLNSIYYGHQAYGIDAAAFIYFGLHDLPGKPAAMQLDLAQSAMLAGIPSNPTAYDPLLHPEAALTRFESVLGLMSTQGYISSAQALAALHEAESPHFFKPPASLQDRAPHFVEFVYTQLEQQFHLTRQQLSRSGMQVYTTLDIGLQDKIQKIAQEHIAELRDAHHLTNAAEVLIDFHTGAIISLLGSIDYNDASIDGQFDVATAYRQPGSSFKPYVYVTAFAQGASPAQAIDDTPTTFPVPDSSPPTFTPSNYDLRFHGHMTLRCALQNSLNVPAVKVLAHVGVNAAMQTAYNMGITSYEGTPGLSLVLGGLGIRLIDHTSAMGVFANGGVRMPYYAINKIVSGNTGKVLYQHQVEPGKQVISPQLAYMMTSVLSDNASRIPEFYDCNVLQLYSNSQQDCWNGNRGVVRPAAAKTGTTNDFRDNWTVGYTTDYVMGVWAGNDDNSPMINVTGVQGAAPIWHDSMLVAEQGHPIRNFVNPGGLVQATVTYPDGVETTDWFLPGTVPTFAAPTPTPTASPAATGTPTPTATAITVTPTPTLNTGEGFLAQSVVPSYCPSSYSFAFSPPPNNVSSPHPGWW